MQRGGSDGIDPDPNPDRAHDRVADGSGESNGNGESGRKSERPGSRGPTGDRVLVAEEVGRTYGETRALDGVSLAVGAGEVFCLIGPNGAGKTTLVRALTGTTDHEGQVSVFGDRPVEVDRTRVGLLPQEFAPASRLTARELLSYYAGLYDESVGIDDLLADLGLKDAADTRYEDLSGGQKRRVCVGTALVNDPDLLFLDEPTTGIDPAGRRALWELLETRAAGGTTILVTTHDMAEAEYLADRVGLLANGRLAEVGTPDELVAAHGGESRLVVEAADPAAGARALSAAGSAYRTEARAGELAVYGVSPAEIGDVVRDLEREAVTYDGLAWSEPTLEDAYLRLTGIAVGREGEPVAATTGSGTDPEVDSGPDGTPDEADVSDDAQATSSTATDTDAPVRPRSKR
jgi:ABC-2 type transport system ATP-binding protein